MLNTPAPFPHPGSAGFVLASGEPVRILQRNADGTCLVSLTDRRYSHEAASGNRTVAAAELVETLAAALVKHPRRKARA